MRQLSFEEITIVAGGEGDGFFDFLADRLHTAALGGFAAAVTGAAIGWVHGGKNTGYLGLSLIGHPVGAITGAIIGAIGGVIGGLLVSYEFCYNMAMKAFESIRNGQIE
ncbi:hypothetical protein ACFSFZ_00560 [Mixta tenebrionis]|uniref:Colicin V synthesis protein n=1 Tax=Mixta tenebrionis TaxID=2562439 RepID=A0A506V543_9GAMM|nr:MULTISPECIES: hypothetical protein [Mixta]QHM77745.1 hypothetical protein C7M52_03748 [Mixta theicola]TPW40490.1 hypothetical protein FKM52_17785 [Mixta tenebrionis]